MSPSASGNIGQVAINGLWKDNPIFRQILGICSTLAVTNMVLNTAVMCTALVFATALSSATVSALRNWTPRKIRMMVQTLIIAFYVIIVDMMLRAYWPEMSTRLGAYVGLIITNCIIMGRAEAFAGTNPPVPSFFDGLFMGLGYSVVLLSISVVRELLGFGTIMGVAMPYFGTPHFDKWLLMIMPPGAFFALGLAVWLLRSIGPVKEDKE
jgi:Na+-transporting NADH:ubiquinone oxidoreductase subunit D